MASKFENEDSFSCLFDHLMHATFLTLQFLIND